MEGATETALHDKQLDTYIKFAIILKGTSSTERVHSIRIPDSGSEMYLSASLNNNNLHLLDPNRG